MEKLEVIWKKMETYLPKLMHQAKIKIFPLKKNYVDKRTEAREIHVRNTRRNWHLNIQNICDHNKHSSKTQMKIKRQKFNK